MRAADSGQYEDRNTSPGGSPFTDILPQILKFSADKGYVQKHDVERAERRILAAIAEAIGEDEEPTIVMNGAVKITPNAKEVHARNRLRAEIRAKLGIEENKT